MRENAATKARRYLTEGRVILTEVSPRTINALVRGDGICHAVVWHPDTWFCTCEARGTCSHLIAVRLVVAVDLLERNHR